MKNFIIVLCSVAKPAKIAELIEDEGLRNELRARGYRYIRKFHDSEQIMEKLLELYRG